MQRIRIVTTIDVTHTGVKNKSDSGDDDWYLRRNQQRNFDTLMQVISLRAQPIIVSTLMHLGNPVEFGLGKHLPEECNIWTVLFEHEHADVFGREAEFLMQELHNIPIVPGLNSTEPAFPPVFISSGSLKNIDAKIVPYSEI